MTMGKAIKVIEIIEKRFITLDKEELQALDMAIKALEQEPKTGHWIEDENEMEVWCSECGEENDDCSKYCPNCGVKMLENEEEE